MPFIAIFEMVHFILMPREQDTPHNLYILTLFLKQLCQDSNIQEAEEAETPEAVLEVVLQGEIPEAVLEVVLQGEIPEATPQGETPMVVGALKTAIMEGIEEILAEILNVTAEIDEISR